MKSSGVKRATRGRRPWYEVPSKLRKYLRVYEDFMGVDGREEFRLPVRTIMEDHHISERQVYAIVQKVGRYRAGRSQ